ncbi:hypothetical protein [Sphingomonas alpina]|nr:hypothetical protein [Sphingomonas alpina]
MTGNLPALLLAVPANNSQSCSLLLAVMLAVPWLLSVIADFDLAH